MTTLVINGKNVTVSDDFLKLSPQEQERTVDEIAKSMGAAPKAAAPAAASDPMAALSGAYKAALAGSAPQGPAATDTMQGVDPAWGAFAAANPSLWDEYTSGRLPRPASPPAPGESIRMPGQGGGRSGAGPAAYLVQSPDLSSTKAFMDAVANGATFGWGPEIVGGVKGLFTGEDETKAIEDRMKAGEEMYPSQSGIGNIMGGVIAPGLGAAKLIAKAPGVILKTLAGAGTGAVSGGLSAAGNADPGERMAAVPMGAVAGGLGGLVLSGLIAGGSSLVNSAMIRRAIDRAGKGAPEADDLRAWAGQQFEEMNRNTTPMPQDAFARDWAGDIQGNMRGVDDVRLGGASRTPEADKLIAELDDLTASARFRGGVPFKAAHQLKRNFADEAMAVQTGSMRPTQSAAAATGGVKVIDDLLDDMTGGQIKGANSAYQRATKAQKFQDMMDNAENYPSGFTSGMRNQSRSAISTPKARRGFSPGEAEAIRLGITGSPFERALRTAGGGLGRLFGAAGGFAGGGVPGALGGYVLSEGASSLADTLTRKNAEALLKALTTGKLAETSGIPDEVIAAIIARLTVGGSSAIPGALAQ